MSVCIIIPCKNEASRIGKVLEAVQDFKRGSKERVDIVVVNDHSRDNLGKLTRGFEGVSVIENRKTGLKEGLLTGFNHAFERKAGVVVTLDADIANLNKKHIEGLVKNARAGHLAVGVLPHFTRGKSRWAKSIRIQSSGQRAYNAADLAAVLKDPKVIKHLAKSPAYGTSVFFYDVFKRKFGKPLQVHLGGVTHTRKAKKAQKLPRFRNVKMFASQLVHKGAARRIK